MFPDVAVIPPRYASIQRGEVILDQYPVDTVISSQSSCPSISIPAGFTDDGLPVGVELLGAPHSEPALIGIAAAYERRAESRRPPASAPSLVEWFAGHQLGVSTGCQLGMSRGLTYLWYDVQ